MFDNTVDRIVAGEDSVMNSIFKPDLRSLLEDVEKNEKDTTKTNHEENDLNILRAKIISLEVAKKENY